MIVLQSIPGIGEPMFTRDNSAIQRFWWELLPLISVVIATLFFKIIVEKNNIKINLFGNAIKNLIVGIIWGIIWIILPILILYLIRLFKFDSINAFSYLYIWIISALLNVIMQEYLVRGYIFELLRKEYNVIVSIIITTIIFTLFHGGAFEAGIISVLNVVTMSIFVSLLLVYSKSLLASIIVHAIWNIIGSL
jgi:membrane protease YdiL (CAAX protease family)